MAATVGRAIDSLFSTIFCYPKTSYKSSNRAYYHTNGHNSSIDTYYYDINNSNNHKSMGKGRPLSLQTVELKVRMCCTGCERVVKNAILKLRGVDSVEVDLALEKVTVTGYVDRNKVLKEVRRSGKKAEFWPNPDQPLFFTTADDYFHDEESFRESYNYWRHGYNGDKHGRIPAHHRGEDRVSNMFNDDDVNACSIM
ncbi:heavy metal-associated isoprenylated plant protein 30-like isoform X1 [Iris pallida]|uniref:Heavy metal-associated isoprenylated plant protein 30-like isoform X1 n=1 Tax=Iris pallida TaxID=29817 RepID=A0AAX6G2F9_IRIPA|nr:heavy metal-associated isoprenylated plant protein 30-like isoform X1 [Iris pallida]